MALSFEEMMANQDAMNKEVEDSFGAGPATNSMSLFKLTYNAEGQSQARVRLLPPGPMGGRFVYKWREHSIDKPRFISTTCPTTFGRSCHVCEKGWEFHHEGNADMRSKLVASERYVAWVLVLADPVNPSNVGKILLYRYGRMIAKMIEDKMNPQFGDDPVNPFRLDKGCDLVIRAKKVGNLPKFDGTVFAESSAVKPPNGESVKDMWSRIPSLEEEFISKIAETDDNKLMSIMNLALGHDEVVAVTKPTTGGMPRPTQKPDAGINTAPKVDALKEDDGLDSFDDLI